MLAGLLPDAAGQDAPRPGATVFGRVLGQDGEPVRAGAVWVTAWGDATRVVQRVRTDGEGIFVCRRLPASNYRVHARALGTTTADSDVLDVRGDRPAVTELRVWEARTLRGRLVDERGNAVAGASLVATKDFTAPPLRVDGTTDRDGAFELAGVPIGDVVLRAIAPGFGYQECTFHDWIDERGDLVLRHDGERLEIRVVDAPATALATAAVRVQAMPVGSFAMPRAIEEPRLGADGVCVLEGLPLADWSVAVAHPEPAFVTSALRALRGRDQDPLRFQALPVEEITVTGRVTLGDAPLMWCPLLVHEYPTKSPTPLVAWTDDDGCFEFRTRSSAGGRLLFELDDEHYVFAQAQGPGRRVTVHNGRALLHDGRGAPTSELQLVAERAEFVRGRVVDAAGAPVPNTPVELQQGATMAPRGDVAWRTFASTVSDARGTFKIGGLRAGTPSVRLRAAGSAVSGSTDSFQIGGAVPELRVGAPARIEGWLTDDAGEPRIGVRVSLGGVRETNAYTDCEGRFLFVGVDAGEHALGYWWRGALVHAGAVTTAAGETKCIDLVAGTR